MSSLIGIGAFIFFFGGMLRATARRWRQLAKSYASDAPQPIEKRSMQTAVLVSAGGFNSLKGIVKIGVHKDGVSLSILPPFSLFHEPLFIPYRDIQSSEAQWYLNARSIELTFCEEPDIKLIMPADQVEWMTKSSAQKISLRQSSVQRQSSTGRWHTFATVNAGVSLIMVGYIGWLVLSGSIPLL